MAFPSQVQEKKWEVEAVLERRPGEDGSSNEFYVKWAGFPPEQNTWEPECNLASAKLAIREFETRRKQELKQQTQQQTTTATISTATALTAMATTTDTMVATVPVTTAMISGGTVGNKLQAGSTSVAVDGGGGVTLGAASQHLAKKDMAANNGGGGGGGGEGQDKDEDDDSSGRAVGGRPRTWIAWTEDEKAHLRRLVREEGTGKWDTKARQLGTGRKGAGVARKWASGKMLSIIS